MEHDISLLVPELWARLGPEERDPEFLKKSGYLERVEDFEYDGRLVPASRLGWRITPFFATTFLGRIFDTPSGWRKGSAPSGLAVPRSNKGHDRPRSALSGMQAMSDASQAGEESRSFTT